MSLTDEGHYGPKQLNLLEVVWGEGFLSPGGTEEIDEIVKNTNLEGKSILDIGCGCGGAAFHLIKNYKAKSVEGEKLFGSITNSDISKGLSDNGIEIEKKYIQLSSNIKKTGSYSAKIRLHREVSFDFPFEVIKEQK